MIVLVLCGIISTLAGTQNSGFTKPHKITLFLMMFLGSMAISIAFSADWSRSMQLSVSFLPALLIFFLITEQFTSLRDIRLLFLCFSITALGISMAALWIAAANEFNLNSNVHLLAGSFSYIIISRNDLIFLALVVPFSFILAYRKPLSLIGVTAILSMLLSLCTIVVFQSRGATLTFLISLSTIAFLIDPRKALWIALLSLLGLFLADAVFGFPLLQRFYGIFLGSEELTNGRSRLWWEALNRFKDAPLLGHGPHTFGLFVKTPWPHNLFVEVLFGHGVAGLLLFLGVLFYGWTAAWRLCRRSTAEIRSFTMGTLAVLCGFGFSALIELSFLRLWVTVTLLSTLGIIVRLSTTDINQ